VRDGLYGQRNFVEGQRVMLEESLEGRYVSFVTDAFQWAGTVWKVFNLGVLARTMEFRQAAAI